MSLHANFCRYKGTTSTNSLSSYITTITLHLLANKPSGTPITIVVHNEAQEPQTAHDTTANSKHYNTFRHNAIIITESIWSVITLTESVLSKHFLVPYITL